MNDLVESFFVDSSLGLLGNLILRGALTID